MSKFTVYSKAGCGQCIFTKNKLTELGQDWEEKRIDLDPDARQEAMDKGAMGAPFVVAPSGETISGFNEKWLTEMAV